MVGIIFGGNSLEHDISIVTAFQLKRKLYGKYKIMMIYQGFDGLFYDASRLKLNDFKNKKKMPKGHFEKGRFKHKKIDCMILAGHGENSEDGLFSRLCELYDIPYYGCNSISSGLCLNKWLTYNTLKGLGISTIETYMYTKNNYIENDYPKNYPLILKPINGGSSIDIYVARDINEFINFSKKLFDKYSSFIYQPFLGGALEYNLALYENGYSCLEKINKGEYFSFDNKYSDSFKIYHQELSSENVEPFYKIARKAYDEMFLNGIVRFDFLVYNSIIYIGEINTTPGALAMYLFEDFIDILDKGINMVKNKKVTNYSNNRISLIGNINK